MEEKLKYCLYARKSTEGDEQQALSIDSQITEMLQIAKRENLNITEIRKESHSAKESGTRDVFNRILKDIDSGLFNAIITWAPDRLSRNAGDLGRLVDLIDQNKLTNIKTFGQTFTDSPSDKFLLMILCSQAKLENDNKSINVKRGLRARVQAGLWPGVPPTGYRSKLDRNKKCEVELDPERSDIVKQIFEKIAYDKWSGRKVHAWLKYDMNFTTRTGKHISVGNIFKIISNPFYYGRFEYPRGSGDWYDGVHEPLIIKELFDLTKASLKKHTMKSYGKEFTFTQLMKCGYCNSGIVADEKFKQLKAGGTNRYVYYRCCKSKDAKCINKAINETDLINEFIILCDDLDIRKMEVNKRLDSEINKFKQLQSMFLGIEKTPKIGNVDIRNYMKFILEQGTLDEKRSMLDCFKSDILLSDKKIIIK